MAGRMKSKLYGLLIGVLLIMSACQSEYQQAVKGGLSSGIIHEDLILGMKMGMTKKEFYSHCWQLNKEKKIHQGSGNQYARYYTQPGEIYEEDQEIDLLFYGIFDEQDVMRGMDMKMSYPTWAPWNKEVQSDVLQERMKKHYMHEYAGNDFIEIHLGIEDLTAYVKIDGNRQILMYPISEKDIAVKIEDLRHKTLK